MSHAFFWVYLHYHNGYLVRVGVGPDLLGTLRSLDPCQPVLSRQHPGPGTRGFQCWGFQPYAKSPKMTQLFSAAFLKAFYLNTCLWQPSSYQWFVQAERQAPLPFLPHGTGIHIFPSCPSSLAPGFPPQQILPADCLNELSSLSHCSDREPLPAGLETHGCSKVWHKTL